MNTQIYLFIKKNLILIKLNRGQQLAIFFLIK